MDTDPTGAYQLAYDATRKAGAATLATRGLRATRSGGHIATRSAAVARVRPARGVEALARCDVMRRRRQEAEYPDEQADLITAAEAAPATESAQAVVALRQTAIPHLEARERGRRPPSPFA